MRPKWEYKIARMEGVTLGFREEYLNKVGQEGWRLVASSENSADGTVTVTFMRQIGGENATAA